MKIRISLFVIILLSLFGTVKATSAFFTSSSDIENKIKTRKYSFNIDISEGDTIQTCVGVVDGYTSLPALEQYGRIYSGIYGYSTTKGGPVEYTDIFHLDINEIDGKTLYPVWVEITFGISYDLDGGYFLDMDFPMDYSYDTPTFTLVNPERAGYTFVGWTGSNGDVPEMTVTIPQGTEGELSYTAHWEEDGTPISTSRLLYIMAPDFAKYDIYFYGMLIEQDFSGTFEAYIDVGTPYEIKNIRGDYGLSLTSYDGNLSGEIGEYGTIINLYFG